MTTNSHYNSHVSMLTDPIPYPSLDKALAITLFIIAFFGFIGNVLACWYFQRNEKRGLAPKLYTIICVIDICTSATVFPVGVSLFADRKPVMFNNIVFCTVWNLGYRYLQIISMYLVLLLSITRCVQISFPFHKVRSSLVIASIILYTVFLMTVNAVVALTPSLNLVSQYSNDVAYCYDWYEKNGTSLGMMIKYVAFVVEAGIPPILTFISFLITIYRITLNIDVERATLLTRIRRKSCAMMVATKNGTNRRNARKVIPNGHNRATEQATSSSEDVSSKEVCNITTRRIAFANSREKGKVIKVQALKKAQQAKEKNKASVTVAVFTLIFLLCNLPFFIVVLNSIRELNSYYDTDVDLYVVGYYWVLSRTHFTVLNALLNPIMYFCRMGGFRQWLLVKLGKTRGESEEQMVNVAPRTRLGAHYVLRRQSTQEVRLGLLERKNRGTVSI